MRTTTGIRDPQREAYAEWPNSPENPAEQEREIGIVLPVGCGKSGCITLTPFAFKAKRTLVVAPGLAIAGQLQRTSTLPARKCSISNAASSGRPYPEPVEIRGTTTNRADLDEADVVITNIQQLPGDENRWLQDLPDDFFDLILFDEGHHNVAASWDTLQGEVSAREDRQLQRHADASRWSAHGRPDNLLLSGISGPSRKAT